MWLNIYLLKIFQRVKLGVVLMKKYIYGCVLFIVIFNTQAMEEIKLSPADDHGCFLLARHLYLHPSIQMTDVHLNKFAEKKQKISDQVNYYKDKYEDINNAANIFEIKFLKMKIKEACSSFHELSIDTKYELEWRHKDTVIGMFLNGGDGIICTDMVNDVVNLKIRSSTIKLPQIIVDNVNLFAEEMLEYYAEFADVPHSVLTEINDQKESLSNITQILEKNSTIMKSDLTVQELFNLCGNKHNDWCLDFIVRNDETCQSQNEKLFSFTDSSLGVDEKRIKIVCGLDFILKMASVHGSRDLIKKICAGSTAGKDGDAALRYQVTVEDKKNLLALHEKAKDTQEWYALRNAAIGVEYTEAWLKDTALLTIPLGIVDGVIPLLVSRYTHGVIPIIFGFVISGVMGSFIGRRVVPVVDSYSFGVHTMRANFGEAGVRTMRWGTAFACYSAMHYIMIKIADQLLQSLQLISYGAGLTIHAIRLGTYLFGLFHKNMIDDPDKPISGVKDFIAYYFGNMRFNNPVLRRTKKDTAPTLGDLVNAVGC